MGNIVSFPPSQQWQRQPAVRMLFCDSCGPMRARINPCSSLSASVIDYSACMQGTCMPYGAKNAQSCLAFKVLLVENSAAASSVAFTGRLSPSAPHGEVPPPQILPPVTGPCTDTYELLQAESPATRTALFLRLRIRLYRTVSGRA